MKMNLKKIVASSLAAAMLISCMPEMAVVKAADADVSAQLVSTIAADAPIDYAQEDNWAYNGIGDGKDADVFLICPSVDTKSQYNMPLENEKIKRAFYNALEMERGIYEDSARLFAPYYRQASLPAYRLDETEREQYLQKAYKDVSDAFAWYMENKNDGRPIILAGFSQGADMCLRILQEYFKNEDLREKLVAAYSIGWPVTEDMTKEYAQIRPAQGETDFGTVISFECEAETVTGSVIIPENRKAISINPLNWKTDGTKADQSLNKGACFLSGAAIVKEENALCGCYIDETRGALKVTDIDPKEYDSTLGGIFPEGSYHIFDYQFFYRNLQEMSEKGWKHIFLQN